MMLDELSAFAKDNNNGIIYWKSVMVRISQYEFVLKWSELVFIIQKWYNSNMKEVRAERKPYPTDLIQMPFYRRK